MTTANNPTAGKLFALLAAVSYGANTTLSRLAYDTGTDPFSLTVYRYLLITIIMIVIMLVLQKPWHLRVSPWLFGGCVIGMYVVSIGHLGAVNYIPVSLSAIIFYTYPLQVIAYRRWVNKNPVNIYEALGFLLAFIGLVIALGPEFQHTDWRGVVLAFSGAIGAALFLICYERFPEDTEAFSATMWISLGTLVLCGATLFGFELTPPVEKTGWVYLWCIAILTVVAFLSIVFAIPRIGAATTALFLNFEPVIILLLAWVVLSEQLSTARLAGVVLVVLSLLISQVQPAKSADKPTRKPR